MALVSQGLKSFVTETELEEQKKKRQEEWEKVRKADDPKECPEEEYDPRSLFDKLQQEKDTKQSQFEEQFKFKNMVRGLDDEESAFLEKVSQKQMERERRTRNEEKEVLDEFKNRVVSVTDGTDKKKPVETKPANSSSSSGINRQASLLAGAVKRKRQTSDESEPIAKKSDLPTSLEDASRKTTDSSVPDRLHRTGETNSSLTGGTLQNGVKCLGILPGIGFYAHSSDESSNSDSSDSDLTEIIGTVHRGSKGH